MNMLLLYEHGLVPTRLYHNLRLPYVLQFSGDAARQMPQDLIRAWDRVFEGSRLEGHEAGSPSDMHQLGTY